MYKAVIYDLFGTIVEPWDVERHRATLNRLANVLYVNANDFARMWDYYAEQGMNGTFGSIGEQLIRVCDALSVHVQPEHVSHAESLLLADARRYLTPTGDALATMIRVKDLGLKSGVISNCGLEVPHLWKELHYSHYIDAPIFSCISGVHKPHGGIYRQALERLGILPEQSLFVDDDPAFVEGARAVGLGAVLITNTPSTQTNDLCVSRLSSILPLLTEG